MSGAGGTKALLIMIQTGAGAYPVPAPGQKSPQVVGAYPWIPTANPAELRRVGRAFDRAAVAVQEMGDGAWAKVNRHTQSEYWDGQSREELLRYYYEKIGVWERQLSADHPGSNTGWLPNLIRNCMQYREVFFQYADAVEEQNAALQQAMDEYVSEQIQGLFYDVGLVLPLLTPIVFMIFAPAGAAATAVDVSAAVAVDVSVDAAATAGAAVSAASVGPGIV